MTAKMVAARRQVKVEVRWKGENSSAALLKVVLDVLSRMNRHTANSNASIARIVNRSVSSVSSDVSMTVEQRWRHEAGQGRQERHGQCCSSAYGG